MFKKTYEQAMQIAHMRCAFHNVLVERYHRGEVSADVVSLSWKRYSAAKNEAIDLYFMV